MHSQKPLTWEDRINWAIEIGSGLHYLHQKNIIHRNLKSRNVFVNSAGTAKLANFGLAETKIYVGLQSVRLKKPSISGTYRWMAPELHDSKHPENNKGCTKKTDMFAFGMLLYELASPRDCCFLLRYIKMPPAISAAPPNTIPTVSPKALFLGDWVEDCVDVIAVDVMIAEVAVLGVVITPVFTTSNNCP